MKKSFANLEKYFYDIYYTCYINLLFSYTIIIIGLFFFFLLYRSEQSPNVMISYISFHTHTEAII